MSSIKNGVIRAVIILIMFAAPAIIFILYGESMKRLSAESIIDEFKEDVSADGVLTLDEYLIFVNSLAELKEGYEVSFEHSIYSEDVFYELADEAKLRNYFSNRNVLAQPDLKVVPLVFEPLDTSVLKMQNETNASVLAMISKDGYVPLPKDDDGNATYVPVVPVQSCYEGEPLVTVVYVEEGGLAYYAEADAVRVTGSGTADVSLSLNGKSIPASISVTVHKRTCKCANGHTVLNTIERIDEYATYGRILTCELCAEEPMEIVPSISSLTGNVGTSWADLGLGFDVIYMDGHVEYVLPEDEELFHNYDSNYYGTQTVSVSYKGFTDKVLKVTLKGNYCKACGAECALRNAADSSRYEYCDLCLSDKPFFFGDTYLLTNVVYHKDIMNALESKGVYYLNRGDYLRIVVSKSTQGVMLPFMNDRMMYTILNGVEIRTDGVRE